ncbi:MAG: hypothetical protein ACI8TP_002818 [Acidimicrobiales bacterium]|jgi:uncharacterized membrane-anchored protein YhcB (DUF1043 family)
MALIAGLLGVMLVAAIALLIAARRSTSRLEEQLQTDLRDARAQLDQKQADLNAVNGDLADALDNAEDHHRQLNVTEQQLRAANDDNANLRTELVDLNDEVEEADRLAEHQSAELASMAIETEDLASQLADALKLAEINRLTAPEGVNAATMWQLELARSERTWRYSVSIYPDDPSPFPDADDLLKLAVETEAAALRDEVGAFLTVEWKLEPIADPAMAHLVLRVAQELLVKASRLSEPSILRAETIDSGSLLAIVPADDGDQIALDLREFADDGRVATAMVIPNDADGSVTVLTNGQQLSSD